MFDIEFYMKTFELTQKLMKGGTFKKQHISDVLERYRTKKPIIYIFTQKITRHSTTKQTPTHPHENGQVAKSRIPKRHPTQSKHDGFLKS